jgi:steroid delta-isomerase-like uncharacterized protein
VDAKRLVESFYADVWNRGDLSVIPALLQEDFTFRGSLGAERRGHAGFAEYVATVRGALAGYRCEILDLVAEERRAFARMRFSGLHVGPFLGRAPSGQRIEWLGAALFTLGDDGRVADLWVLGDTQALDAQLLANSRRDRPAR